MAAVLGGAVGLERELSGKPAGLRTNILICVGAALFTHISIAVAEIGFSPDGHPYGDTTRIAAQIVSGIGFLGAGAILHARGAVVGLTTAATIWVVAAIGSAVGGGLYVEAVGTTILVGLVLVGLRPVERRMLGLRRKVSATVRVDPERGPEEVFEVLRAAGVHVLDSTTFVHPDDRTIELRLVGSNTQLEVALERLHRHSGVISASFE